MANRMDHVADSNGVELHRLAKLYAFPEFVKSADFKSNWQPENLPATVYGDPRTQQFPCHSQASTWLSHLYFNEKRAELAPTNAFQIEQRLNKFAKYWGITALTDQIKVAYDEMHKDADSKLPDSSFAYVWVSEDGHKQRNMRMVNPVEVKTAADWLHKYRDRIPFSDRHKIAQKIMQKVAQFGVGLGESERFIHQQAGLGICNPSEVQGMLKDRARIVKDAGVKEALEKMASTVANKPRAALGPQMLVKIATTVDMVDRGLGIVQNQRYGENLPRPEDVLFKVTIKEAKDGVKAACAMTSGTIYDRGDFERVKLADVESLFGKDFATEVATGLKVDPEKMAELASTMPRDDADLFDRFMNDCGIEPMQVKSASAKTGFSFADLNQLAQQY